MAIHTHKRFYDEDNKAQILIVILAWRMQQYACIGRQTPIVVLSAAVNARERFLV